MRKLNSYTQKKIIQQDAMTFLKKHAKECSENNFPNR